MLHDRPVQVPDLDLHGEPLPSPEQSLVEAKRRLALTFRRNELSWILAEQYDPDRTAWYLDLLRQGATGRWMRQRYRFDAQAEVLYFLGESALGDAEFKAARRTSTIFSVPEWQDRAAEF